MRMVSTKYVALAGLIAGAIPAAGAATPPQTAATSVTVTNPASRPVPSQDVDSPLRNYYQELASVNCSAGGYCQATPPATTAHFTRIHHVSCLFYMTSPAIPAYAFAGATGVAPYDLLQIITLPQDGGKIGYMINTDVELVLTAGETPYVGVNLLGGGTDSLQCSISGSTGS